MKITVNETKFNIKTTVTYIDSESSPEAELYFFSYHIHIANQSSVPMKLLRRHWIITDAYGQTEEVKGDGVVGLQPQIAPGSHFEYQSACPIPTSTGSMKGYYLMQTPSGEEVQVPIPEFFLVAPHVLH